MEAPEEVEVPTTTSFLVPTTAGFLVSTTADVPVTLYRLKCMPL